MSIYKELLQQAQEDDESKTIIYSKLEDMQVMLLDLMEVGSHEEFSYANHLYKEVTKVLNKLDKIENE